MANMDYNTWKHTVLGVGLDIDGAYGRQCVDVFLSYVQACFPGIHWSVLVPPVTSAKDLFNNANTRYFQKIENNHADVNQLPRMGDVAVFAASPEEGYTSAYVNPDGHVGIVDHADSSTVYLIQQDGGQAKPITEYKARSWRYTRCIGWLRPKFGVEAAPAPSLGDGRIGRMLYVHGIPAKAVVKVGAEPVSKNIYNYLWPGYFQEGPAHQPGLLYRIEGVSQYPNTVTIRTQSFGLVDVLVDKDCEIL